ncbi:helix-turn-helix domain-containing protein [Anaerococcus sp. Marseille-P9784]|uniref:helix-turn-helix domain-containing protein n=1 Tax=Anaerococcus sp. Marseille-P9784 TaxID=2614127 RepID=UPI00124A2700|nr:helix-turn-helix domain-containing protein [Anaerococcus sp. Marseille-P9784]
MAKYSTEFKMKVVKEYLESNISYKSLSDKYCIPSESVVKSWVNAYKSQGYEGLKVKRKNTQYTLEFKLNVVNLYLTGEMSYQSLANNLKINNPSIITRWVNEYREKGIEGLRSKKRGRPSKMPKSPKRSKDTKIESSANITNLENESLTQAQLKEKIKKLEEENYWLQLENDAIKKKIELSQMTDTEIRQLLKQSKS